MLGRQITRKRYNYRDPGQLSGKLFSSRIGGAGFRAEPLLRVSYSSQLYLKSFLLWRILGPQYHNTSFIKCEQTMI
jgi:hypothetical protein